MKPITILKLAEKSGVTFFLDPDPIGYAAWGGPWSYKDKKHENSTFMGYKTKESAALSWFRDTFNNPYLEKYFVKNDKELATVSNMEIKNYLSAKIEQFPKGIALKMASQKFGKSQSEIRRASFFWGL